MKKSETGRTVEVEICTYSVESCLNAREGGATRVELCASPAEGGTTPSAATISMAREIDGLELSVMIRPRGGDFLYSELEFEQMRRDISVARELGADGVVFGILTAGGDIDVARTAELVELAYPMEVTFHRAFDMAKEPARALEDVIKAGCVRLLTSGCHNTAMEGIGVIRALTAQAAGRIEIMAGSGVNPSNAGELLAAGVDALHLSAKALREGGMTYRRPGVAMAGAGLPEYEIACSDPAIIKKVVAIARTK